MFVILVRDIDFALLLYRPIRWRAVLRTCRFIEQAQERVVLCDGLESGRRQIAQFHFARSEVPAVSPQI